MTLSDEKNLSLHREDPYPLQNHLGFELKEWRKNFCLVELPIKPFLLNRYGIPHGGIHATLLDTAMGYCACYSENPNTPIFAMTLSLTVNYLGQSTGNTLIAEAHQTGGGRKTFFAQGSVTDDTGMIIATATGVFRFRAGANQNSKKKE
jgi:uncharacterized protein (TIGR00369 family)